MMWTPIDTQFYAPRLPVAIAALPDSGEVYAIRDLLELLICTVHVHWIGAPADFLKIIGQGVNLPRYLVIAGHGAEKGFYFGEYAPFVDTAMLTDAYLPPAVVQQHVNLPNCVVIALTCNGGHEAMVRAFLAGGVAAYIGCRQAPDAIATHVFLTNFFFNIRVKNMADRDAWYRAIAATDHEDIYAFSYVHGDGTEERFPQRD